VFYRVSKPALMLCANSGSNPGSYLPLGAYKLLQVRNIRVAWVLFCFAEMTNFWYCYFFLRKSFLLHTILKGYIIRHYLVFLGTFCIRFLFRLLLCCVCLFLRLDCLYGIFLAPLYFFKICISYA
jgi:hypothetical protein